MHLTSFRRALLGAFAVAGTLFAATTPASAFSYTDGNLVVAFVKNGFELILNLGASPTTTAGTNINVASLALPSQFGGSLSGATWTALSVRNPNAQITNDPNDPLFGLPQNNIILTTAANPSIVSYNNIGDAQAQLQPPNQGIAWFALLKTIGVANGNSIIENSATRAVIGTTLYASYSANVGLGSNAVGNSLPLSTAGIVSGAVVGDSLPLYELVQTVTFNNATQDYDLGTQITNLGAVRLVPEPGTALLLGAGIAGLVSFGGRRGERA